MHRLFVALRPPPELREFCLETGIDGPRGWEFLSDEQVHLTLRFIGEVDGRTADDIVAALGRIHASPVELALNGVGQFDHGKNGVLFAKVTPRDPLHHLHRKIDRALSSAGLEPERRAFHAHITLARKRAGAARPDDWLARHVSLTSPPCTIRHMTLFESHLGRDGPLYEAVARFPLDHERAGTI